MPSVKLTFTRAFLKSHCIVILVVYFLQAFFTHHHLFDVHSIDDCSRHNASSLSHSTSGRILVNPPAFVIRNLTLFSCKNLFFALLPHKRIYLLFLLLQFSIPSLFCPHFDGLRSSIPPSLHCVDAWATYRPQSQQLWWLPREVTQPASHLAVSIAARCFSLASLPSEPCTSFQLSHPPSTGLPLHAHCAREMLAIPVGALSPTNPRSALAPSLALTSSDHRVDPLRRPMRANLERPQLSCLPAGESFHVHSHFPHFSALSSGAPTPISLGASIPSELARAARSAYFFPKAWPDSLSLPILHNFPALVRQYLAILQTAASRWRSSPPQKYFFKDFIAVSMPHNHFLFSIVSPVQNLDQNMQL
ncbi:unnamed protein product [Protopolystoma xenopodis]|uniref:Uncharacterized protein n=1 Tax=Protopolystoma xenopodis TaxID=117903 RepID=A0A448WDA6_9PLAT|nr:unnamed protein product [Protopolystoma xenopodis]